MHSGLSARVMGKLPIDDRVRADQEIKAGAIQRSEAEMCPNRDVIDRLLATDAGSPELTELRAHVKECASCRENIARAAKRALVGKVALEGGHPEAGTLAQYLEGELTAHVRLLLGIHLSACRYCRERQELMQAGRQRAAAAETVSYTYQPVVEESRPRIPRLIWKFAVPLAAAAIAAVLLPSVFRKQPDVHLAQAPVHQGKVSHRTGKAPARRSLDELCLAVLEKKMVPDEKLGSQERELVGKKFPGGKPQLLAALPTSVRTLGPSAEQQAGSEFTLVSPQPDVLIEPRVAVRWNKAAGARGYRLELYDADLKDQPLHSVTTRQTHGGFPNLKFGGRYSLRIVPVGSESPPIEFDFAIISDSERKQLDSYADSHLLRGIFFEKKRLFTNALHEYRALSGAHPDSKLARQAYEHLQSKLEETKAK